MRRMYSKPQLLEAVESESKVNGIKVFEDIKDKDGHARFIEGEMELTGNEPTGVTLTYGKWSLSGTHIMFVMCLTLENGVTLSDGLEFGQCKDLPSWIFDKIYPVWNNRTIEYKGINSYSDNWLSQSIGVSLDKTSTKIRFVKQNTVTMTATRNIRIAFDLLIDNE